MMWCSPFGHHWSRWELKTRTMVIATAGLLGRQEDVGKEYIEEFQERQCLDCGFTKRAPIERP